VTTSRKTPGMSRTETIPLPRKHFGFDAAADLVSAAGPHADTPHAPLAVTEPTKAETTR
jgi:hypothetical protein